MITLLIIMIAMILIYGSAIVWVIRSNNKLLKPYKQKASYPVEVNWLLEMEK